MALSRRQRYTVAYVLVTMTTFLLAVFLLRMTDIWFLCRTDASVNKDEQADSFLLAREAGRSSYDHLMNYLLHPQANCQSSRVVGGKRGRNRKLDGDKMICLDPGTEFKEDCIVYSFGIAHDWSFDEAVRKLFGCHVFSFDPSMGMGDHQHEEGILFYNTGLGEFNGHLLVSEQTWDIKTLDTIQKQLGHSNRTIDILKMDIEGAEYLVLEDMLNKGLLKQVNHLCVEIHLLDNPYWTRVYRLLRRIEEEAGLRHFSTRNNTQMTPTRVPGIYDRYEQHFFELAWYRIRDN